MWHQRFRNGQSSCNKNQWAFHWTETMHNITLLPKKNKDRLFLKHWRTISLLNTDYKIIAKLIANRMKEVCPAIISEDQFGYLKGRYIGQNIRLLQDISFFTELKQLLCKLLAINFEKAFDSLNWNFLLKALEHVNFGPNFIIYVKLMYNNIESAVLNNGSTGNYFKLEEVMWDKAVLYLPTYLFWLSKSLQIKSKVSKLIIRKSKSACFQMI